MTLDGFDAQLAIRWLHVVAGTVIAGGALLLAVAGPLWREGAAGARNALTLELSRAYEWAFWAAAGLIVATGVGNLGAFASGLTAPQTDWGRTLLVKLSTVLVLMLFSLTRTLVVVQSEGDAASLSLLRGCYGVTAALALAIVALAGALAHG